MSEISLFCHPYFVYCRRVYQRRDIAQRLVQVARTDYTAHYLRVASFGQVANKQYFLWSKTLAKLTDDGCGDLIPEKVRWLGTGAQNRKYDDHFAFEFVGDADGSGFANERMADSSGFNFGRAEPLACYFDGVVGAAEDVPVTLVVDHRPV